MTSPDHGPTVDLDALLRTCIHCGLCLNACPTYRLSGDEAESPRGRLVLLREVLAPDDDGTGSVDRGPLDRCMGCRGCETVCPSGVPYGLLLEEARADLPEPEPTRERWVRFLVREVLPHRRRLAVVAGMGQWLRSIGGHAWLPAVLGDALRALPRRPARWPRSGRRGGARVALLTGCAQSVFTPEVHEAVVRLAEAAGVRIDVPARQSCCGALAAHEGLRDEALALARRYVEDFADYEEVVVAAAGCSAHLKHLERLFTAGGDDAARARDLARRTHDVLPWLLARADRLHFVPDPRRVAYHPPCHHLHAQGVDGVAEQLLDRVPQLERVEFPRRQLCCGSAGAWSLHQPSWAAMRRDEKLADIAGAAPDLVLTANPGCELFLDAAGPQPVRVQHLATYLASRLESVG